MKKILKQGASFTGWSIKLIGLKLKKFYGIDLGITGNNGKNYFKHRLENKYNVYFMKHWSSFGEIYDAENQQITNIVPESNHKIINEHWRGFSHPEVFNRYSTKAVKVAEYNHNFSTNDGPRLVFAKDGEASFVFWGVYELDHIDNRTKTKVWKLVSTQYGKEEPAKKSSGTKKVATKKVATKKVK